MNLREFESREGASRAAAAWIESRLRRGLEQAGPAGLIVSGGSTPGPCLEMLSKADLNWQQVEVSLTDERLVPADDDASNERMVRECLLRGDAATAPFRQVGELPAATVVCSLVGMGNDGHFASIFPDNPALVALLDGGAAPAVLEVTTAASPYPRKTINLAYLLQGQAVLLLIFGADKKKILAKPGGLPIAALLQQGRVAVEVYWAP